MRNGYNNPCKIDECDSVVGRKGSHGMCGKHAIRVKRYDDPHYITPEKVRAEKQRTSLMKTLGPAKKTSYLKFYGRHEHRVVAEKTIGRPLTREDVVHHIDGDKHNNHPDNLEVMTQTEHVELHRREMLDNRKEKHGY